MADLNVYNIAVSETDAGFVDDGELVAWMQQAQLSFGFREFQNCSQVRKVQAVATEQRIQRITGADHQRDNGGPGSPCNNRDIIR